MAALHQSRYGVYPGTAASLSAPNDSPNPLTNRSTDSVSASTAASKAQARFLGDGDDGPMEKGFGIRLAPGFELARGTTMHPSVSYTYLAFEGGRDDLIELGGQVRRQITPGARGLAGFWFGGEAAFAMLRTRLDFAPTSTTNGWSLTALAGVPVGGGAWGIHLFGGAGISHYGTSGMNLRAGVEVQPPFATR
jgi:hypothetical protein